MNIVVTVSDMKLSNDPETLISTYSLGSCIGISIHDPVAQVGGILHFMLPESKLDPIKAEKNPYMFADTGIPRLFDEAYDLGGKKERMKIAAFGGAQILGQKGLFNIGERNNSAVRKILSKNNIVLDYEDLGGSFNRTLKLAVKNGRVWVKVSGKGEKEI